MLLLPTMIVAVAQQLRSIVYHDLPRSRDVPAGKSASSGDG
jgi:hypothetical protein